MVCGEGCDQQKFLKLTAKRAALYAHVTAKKLEFEGNSISAKFKFRWFTVLEPGQSHLTPVTYERRVGQLERLATARSPHDH